MSKDFPVQEPLLNCIDKVKEGMNVLIDVYDRIDSYFENSKLIAFMVGISSESKPIAGSIVTDDNRINDALTRLRKITQTNRILDQHEAIINALKQHSFPFASEFIGRYQLPNTMDIEDTETLVQTTIAQIEELRRQLKQSKILLGKHDREIYRSVEFSSSNSATAPPFYVWKNRNFKNEISRLLQGEEITINADITKGLNQNAVKFNEIGIRFKAKSENIQGELDNELNHFGVTMAMISNNYYRCGSRFYYNSVDENIVISYAMKKDAFGKQGMLNEIYHKVHDDTNYFLSPYTMWSVQLIKLNLSNSDENFEHLSRFSRHSLDLELTGRRTRSISH